MHLKYTDDDHDFALPVFYCWIYPDSLMHLAELYRESFSTSSWLMNRQLLFFL